MNGLSYMPWFPRDFRSATLTWPPLARLLYRELLDAQWDSGGLPDHAGQLREIARLSLREWRSAWRWVEPKFPVSADGLRRNERLEQHRAHSLKLRAFNSERASAAARARWNKPGNGDASSNAPSIDSAMPEAMLQASAGDASSNASNSNPKGRRRGGRVAGRREVGIFRGRRIAKKDGESDG